jgi:hypothetical protein
MIRGPLDGPGAGVRRYRWFDGLRLSIALVFIGGLLLGLLLGQWVTL